MQLSIALRTTLTLAVVIAHGTRCHSLSFAGEELRNPPLPKVLLIGDSISIGYTPFVTEILKSEATVVHHKGNAQTTTNGLKRLESWLGDTPWHVIHFNWGLWDLCYRGPTPKGKEPWEGPMDKAAGRLSTTPAQYEKNLEQLVLRLKKTGAKLIWASTTLVPAGENGRFVGDDKKYNAVAAKVMKRHKIEVNDLHKLTSDFPPELFKRPADVHYTEAGSQKIADQVASKIRKQLSTSHSNK